MAVDFIIDFETLGKEDNSVLLSIGVLPCPNGKTSLHNLLKSGLHIKLDHEQQIAKGRTIDRETIEWWKSKSKEAREVFSKDGRQGIATAQLKVRSFMFENGFTKDGSKIWSRGMIDQRWWQSFCKTCQKYDPNINDFLPFYIWRDIRTALDIMVGDPKPILNSPEEQAMADKYAHNALIDCALDFIRIQEALEVMNA